MSQAVVDKQDAVLRGPRRTPAHGGYARGDETRQRVIAAAIDVFRKHGYQQSSTREIAARAGVNPPALQYYFTSKLGLYRTCIDQVTRSILERIGPLLLEGDDLLSAAADTEALIAFYCRLQDSLIDSFLSPYEGEVVSHLLFWESLAPGTEDGQIMMRDRVELPIMRVLSGIVGRLLRRPATDRETGMHTFAASGIFRIFHVDSRRTQSLFGWSIGDAGTPALIKSTLRLQSTALLRHLDAMGETSLAEAGAAPIPPAASVQPGCLHHRT